jgi:peroxiredoxin
MSVRKILFLNLLLSVVVTHSWARQTSPAEHLERAVRLLKEHDAAGAVEELRAAVDQGFRKYHLLEQVPIFDQISSDPEFVEIIGIIKADLGIGLPARDLSVPLLEGARWSLRDRKGKVVLVDFWATWCRPCLKEFPVLREIYTRFADRGFEIVGISLDENLAALRSFLEREKLPWIIGFSGSGWDDPAARVYGVDAIPSTWLIDRHGVLREAGLRGEALRDAVARLVAEERDGPCPPPGY